MTETKGVCRLPAQLKEVCSDVCRETGIAAEFGPQDWHLGWGRSFRKDMLILLFWLVMCIAAGFFVLLDCLPRMPWGKICSNWKERFYMLAVLIAGIPCLLLLMLLLPICRAYTCCTGKSILEDY